MKISWVLLLVLILGSFISPEAYGQTIDQELARRGLTFEQAQRLARQSGVDPNNPDELARFARNNGVPEAQIQQYLIQLRQLQNPDTSVSDANVTDLTGQSVTSDQIQESEEPMNIPQEGPRPSTPEKSGLPYFGYQIFADTPDAFKPGTNGPVDEGYVIGPDDELRLTIWGATEFQYDMSVDAEGRSFIPNIGLVTLAGQSLKTLRESLKVTLSKSYSGLVKDPPTIFMDLTVTRFKPIRVFVLGEVKNPGGYTFTSNASIFNVLYGVGGPTVDGSLRDIRIIRDGKEIASVDLYDLLLRGIDPTSVPLLNNDRIFIPPRKSEVSITGPVRRPAIFELKQGEGVKEIIEFAGGLKPEAYSDRFQIRRIIPFEERNDPSDAREVLDNSLREIISGNEEFYLQDGDKVTIFSITDVLDNIVRIEGAVDQPGVYQLSDTLRTIRDLVLAADSLTGDAFLQKAEIIRTNEDSTQTFISLDLRSVMNDDPSQNLVLRKRDRFKIYSRLEIEQNSTVSINGAVRNPTEYRWRDSLRVFDVLFKSGGLFDPEYRKRVLLTRADLVRRNEDGRTTNIISFNLEEALNEEGFGLEIMQPFDQIKVYENTVQLITDKYVVISGAVKSPGRYNFNENMTLEDLIMNAMGFSEDAYLGEVEITRTERPESQSEKAKKLTFELLEDESEKYVFYSNDIFWDLLDRAEQFELQHRDRVYIRPNPLFNNQETVTISGEVRFPGTYTLLSENEKLSNFINRAGGLTLEGYAKGARLVRDSLNVVMELDKIINGNQRADVLVQGGDSIYVPKDPNVVLVTGNVGLDGFIKHEPGAKIEYYLDRAGGLQANSYKYVQLTQANGATYRVRRKGLFKQNPEVEDGAVIRVIYEEPKPSSEKPSFREIFSETISILSATLTIIVLVDRL